MSTITIVGSGMMGTGIARPALDNGHHIRLVGTPLDRHIISELQAGREHPKLHRELPTGTEFYQIEELATALEGADLVVSGVSSFGVEWFATTVLPLLQPGQRVLAVTKGLRPKDESGVELESFPEYLSRLRPDVDFMAVGGPCTSYELYDRHQTVVYFVGKNAESVTETASLFRTQYYHPVPSTDLFGVEIAVALKNAYALGVSLAVGLAERQMGLRGTEGMSKESGPGAPDANPMYNPQAALFGQSVLEMRRLLNAINCGQSDFAAGLAGAGDLYVTVFGGRTRKIGTLLGRGMTYAEAREALDGVTLESVAIIGVVSQWLRQRIAQGKATPDETPLMLTMDGIIRLGNEVNIPWDKFGV